jgi:hypothetical protein
MKPLRFIHISKTGGQTIAKVARDQAQIEWGMYDKQYKPGNIKSRELNCRFRRGSDQSSVFGKVLSNVSCHILLSNIQHYETIDKYDWFMVVRNPYDRFISLYNWYIMRTNEKIGMNEYLQREFQYICIQKNCIGCHFTEQYRYLDPHCHIHVLHYENLEEEFNLLMKEYGHNIVLNIKCNVSNKIASLEDLTLETIETINKIYEKDFTTFHYEMRHSIFQREES